MRATAMRLSSWIALGKQAVAWAWVSCRELLWLWALLRAACKNRIPLKLFFQLKISKTMVEMLHEAEFMYPTPIQELAIPPAMEGRDVLATAQTGTGKTLSFLVPIIERLAESSPDEKALVMMPTRELAMQVIDAWQNLTQSEEEAALICGGMPERPQLAALRQGARLIVATPGRLEDYLRRGKVHLDTVRILVLDEVDRMLDMGFEPSIRRIADLLPDERQTLCYSATLAPKTADIAKLYLKDPVRVDIAVDLKPSANVALQSIEVNMEKKQELLELLLGTNEGSFMVFVKTKMGADRVTQKLTAAGFNAVAIHGDRNQSQRNAALSGFTQGRFRVLVATDVVARGIAVAGVAHVVNFDMPREAEDFVHRVGRTGRASSKGVASTFVTPKERRFLRRMEMDLKVQPTRYRVAYQDAQMKLVA